MMADRLLLLEGGVIRQAGTPEEVYTRPASREVAAFFGMQNQLPAILRRAGDGWRAESPAGTFRLAGAVPGAREGAPATLVLRQAFPGLIEGGAAAGTLTGRVLEVRFTEDGYATTLEAGGIRLTFLLEARAAPGEVLRLQIRPGDLSVFVQEVP